MSQGGALQRTFWATVLFAAIAIVATATLSWVSYRSVRRALEDEFARRLQGIAATGASQVSAQDLADARLLGEDGTGYIALQLLLEQLRSTPGTVHASVLDSTGVVVYDTRGVEFQGSESPLDTLAHDALERALAGQAVVSELYPGEGQMQRAGLAPIPTVNGHVAGVLAVEARVGYLDALGKYRQTLLLTALVISGVIALLAVVILRGAWASAQLERRLSRAENLAAMGRLTATLAHEIKNPLAIIRGSAQRLSRLDPEAQRMADYVVEEADRLSKTVARYLQFAKGDPAGAGPGDALDALNATLDLLEGELQERKITVERGGIRAGDAGPPSAPDTPNSAAPGSAPALGIASVALDPESLKQVYLNQILNAVEAMPDGGRMRVGLSERKGRIEVRIADEGPGIPPEVLKKLGRPFYTTKAQGSGLGLFLTRRLVQSAGGTLVIDSQEGRGTTCVVSFPRTQG